MSALCIPVLFTPSLPISFSFYMQQRYSSAYLLKSPCMLQIVILKLYSGSIRKSVWYRVQSTEERVQIDRALKNLWRRVNPTILRIVTGTEMNYLISLLGNGSVPVIHN